MKTDKRSAAIRVSWIFGILFIFILGMLCYLFYRHDGLRLVTGLWIIGISFIANLMRKELKREINNKEK